MKNKLIQLFQNKTFVLITYSLLVVFIALRAVIISINLGGSIGNNYLIFKNSFQRLIENNSMYVFYTNLDLYKYSPTFAVWMAPFQILDDKIGIFLWMIIQTFTLIYAILKLPNLSQKLSVLALWFIINECSTSLMNCQTNSSIVALMILSFIAIENKNITLSTLFVMLAFFIKPYAAATCIIYIFYPNKLKIIVTSIFWFIFLAALPLIFISYQSYLFQLTEWKTMLQNDHAVSFGMSVMGLLKNNLLIEAKNETIIIGTIILFLPLIKTKFYDDFGFRVKFLASILVWVIIFNHKAESPTFIIAVSGIAIWYFYGQKSVFDTCLLVFVLILTQLGNTDIFPAFIRNEFIRPRDLKALPCLLVWLKINYELMFYKSLSTRKVMV